MKRFTNSLLAACMVGGLSGGVGLAATAFSNNIPSARALEEHWRHPDMHHAMASLREARDELTRADDGLRGHRDEAVEEIDKAVHHVEEGLREQRDDAALPADLPRADRLGKRPHIDRGLEALQRARSQISDSSKVFGRHREEAMEHIDNAIRHLQEGLHEVER